MTSRGSTHRHAYVYDFEIQPDSDYACGELVGQVLYNRTERCLGTYYDPPSGEELGDVEIILYCGPSPSHLMNPVRFRDWDALRTLQDDVPVGDDDLHRYADQCDDDAFIEAAERAYDAWRDDRLEWGS